MHKVPRTIKRVPVKVQRHQTFETRRKHENTAGCSQTLKRKLCFNAAFKGKGHPKTADSWPLHPSSRLWFCHYISDSVCFISSSLTSWIRGVKSSVRSRSTSFRTEWNSSSKVNMGCFSFKKKCPVSAKNESTEFKPGSLLLACC